MTTARRYVMDDETFQHLTDWCEDNVSQPDVVRESIMMYLTKLDVEDAEYSLRHGWWHVYNLVIA